MPLLASIERGEKQRRALESAHPAVKAGEKILRLLPRAAAEYRSVIAKWLDGDPRAAAKARLILRDLFGGKIRLRPERGGGLVAHWNLEPGALLRAEGSSGSGGAIAMPIYKVSLS